MRVNETPTPSISPEAPPTQPPAPLPKLSRKKLYIIIGLIAVASVASASAFAIIYLLPKGEAATIPLSLNYTVGEKMTYEMTMTMNMMGQTYTQTGTISMETLSLDGEIYTIRQTMQFQGQQFSYTMKMDKTGRLVDYSGLPFQSQQMSYSFIGMPGFGSYFPKAEMKVGESGQIPLSMSSSGYTMTGTVYFRVSETRSVTVPAGTYNAFKMEITAPNIQVNYGQPGATVNMVVNLNGYQYLEMGTCRPIEFNIQETVTGTSMGLTYSMTMTMQMRLVQHTTQ